MQGLPADGYELLQISCPGYYFRQWTTELNLFKSIRWKASVNQPWVKLSETSGTMPYDDIYATFEDNGLKGGVHSAAVTLTSPDVPDQEIVLDVVVIVSDNAIYLPALWR